VDLTSGFWGGNRCAETEVFTVDSTTQRVSEAAKREALLYSEGRAVPTDDGGGRDGCGAADDVRDGMGAGADGSVTVAQAAFGAAPKTVDELLLSGRLRLPEKKLLRWLLNENARRARPESLVWHQRAD